MKLAVLSLLIASSLNAATLDQQIDAYIKPYRDLNAFSGVILAARGDKVVFAKPYGSASYEHNVPNALDTRFAIASITKRFTSVILRGLEAENKISRDEKLSKWVPDFPSAAEITVDHLINHRSGLRDPRKLRGIIRRSYTTADVVALLKTDPLGSKPGETYSYTTANYAVLAHIIERVTGKSYAEVVRQYVYEPAKMRDSGELATASVVPRLASGYMPNPFGPGLAVCGPEDPSWKLGGGSSYSTVADMHRFARAYFNGTLVPKDTAATNSRLHEKPVMTLSGSFPGAGANLIYFPEEEITVVVLTNNYATVASNVAEVVAGMMLGKTYEPPAVKLAPDPHTAPAQAAGDYAIEGMPWTFSIRFRDGRPYVSWTEVRQSAMLRVSEDTWFEPLDWATLKLRFDATGAVTGGMLTFAGQEGLPVIRR